MGAIELNRFVCIYMHSRIFRCSNEGDSIIHIGGGLTYLHFWEDVTKLFTWTMFFNTTCIPRHFVSSIYESIAQISSRFSTSSLAIYHI